MLEPPKLAEAQITAAIRAHYDISVTALTFLPLGADSASWVYRIDASKGQSYFLKLRANDGFSPASLAIPSFLRSMGLPHIAAPLLTQTQSWWVSLDGYALSLYPFIEGHTGAHAGLSERQWRAFGALMCRIHNCRLPTNLLRLIPRERFVPSRRHVITDLEAAAKQSTFANTFEREFSMFWSERRDVIRALVERADALGSQLRSTTVPQVLCHADMHTWNVLLDRDQQMWLIDWDEVILALKERDLMFVVGGIGGDGVGSQETAYFLQEYGETSIDSDALTYYRYAWAVQDIAANGEQVFLSENLSEEARSAALQGFMDLFEPGNIIPRALGSN